MQLGKLEGAHVKRAKKHKESLELALHDDQRTSSL